ncbi:MAG: NAD(P)-binding domain-containing protein [Solirubrobacterales bacterium]|nr:NAD(P)-binding domain-containing protein [Solirubrobacterales bacterium]
MRIGIIGAGNIGGAFARRFSERGHEVSVANSRGPETLREVEAETGATAVTAQEAVRDKDVVVVTIPEKKVPQLPDDLFAGVGDGVVMVDTGNYYPRHRDGRIAEIEQGMPESVWVARRPGVIGSTEVPRAYEPLVVRGLGRPTQTVGRSTRSI